MSADWGREGQQPRRAKSGSSRSRAFGQRCGACGSPVKASWARCPQCRIATPAGAEGGGGWAVAAGGGAVLKSSFAFEEGVGDSTTPACAHGWQASPGVSGREAGSGSGGPAGREVGPVKQGEGGDAEECGGDAEQNHALYDVGLWWIVHNNKMVVAGFEPSSRGRELGIRPVRASHTHTHRERETDRRIYTRTQTHERERAH